jgi:nucleotide-binding universal stress UspA family protein
MLYSDILFPVDLTEESSWRDAMPVVLKLVGAFNSRLHVLTVVPDYGMNLIQQYFPEGAEKRVMERTSEALKNFVSTNVPEHIDTQVIVAQGTVYESILETAEKVGSDLIVMTAHRPELKDYLLGPNAARVVRHSDCSVLVVRQNGKVEKAK